MNIIVAIKVVPDDKDISIAANGSLDMSKAHPIISEYDLNAIEAAKKMAASQEGSTIRVITVGSAQIDDSKLKKSILSRGIDELYMVADDSAADMDAYATAQALVELLKGLGDWDVVLCGDGSADNYARQVDVQLAYALGVPSVSGVVFLQADGSVVRATRELEDVVEEVEIECPCVVAVSPEVAEPCIPGMRDILAAGKKPMNVTPLASSVQNGTEVIAVRASQVSDRRRQVSKADEDGAIDSFVAALKAAL